MNYGNCMCIKIKLCFLMFSIVSNVVDGFDCFEYFGLLEMYSCIFGVCCIKNCYF